MLCASLGMGWTGSASGGPTTSTLYGYNPSGMSFPSLTVGCPANTFASWSAADIVTLNTKLTTLTNDLATANQAATAALNKASSAEAAAITGQAMTVQNLANIGITPESVTAGFAFGFLAVFSLWAAGYAVRAATTVIRKL